MADRQGNPGGHAGELAAGQLWRQVKVAEEPPSQIGPGVIPPAMTGRRRATGNAAAVPAAISRSCSGATAIGFGRVFVPSVLSGVDIIVTS
jgi:hypothetical protein